MNYSRKTIQDLKPQWYCDLSTKEKLKAQSEMREQKEDMWNDKPQGIKSGEIVMAKKTVKNITEGKKYRVINHFCTLVTTIYYSQWHQFVTIKNDNGYSVKMNLNKFESK